LNPIEVT